MKVLSAMQLKKGAKAKGAHVSASLTQPLQFLPCLLYTSDAADE